MKTTTITSVIFGAALILGAAVFLTTDRSAPPTSAAANDSVSVNATDVTNSTGIEQVIEITAKGGYTPPTSHARAGAPLLLKLKTDGTFDCSAALRIASIGWSGNLSPTGEVAVQIPPQKAGTTLVGVCSMGMHNFKITFE